MSAPPPARPSWSAGNLVTGTASKYLVLAVNLALGIFLLPFTIEHLGTADYGLWMVGDGMKPPGLMMVEGVAAAAEGVVREVLKRG